MNTIILIKLIAAHLLGDFILQSDKMCTDKFSKDSSAQYKALIIHALIQAALAYIFVSQWNCWIIPVVIGISHFLIDFIKTRSRKNDLISFLWDQAAHYSVIIGLWWLMFRSLPQMDMSEEILSAGFCLIITAYIAILAPTSIRIKLFIEYEKWMPASSTAQGMF